MWTRHSDVYSIPCDAAHRLEEAGNQDEVIQFTVDKVVFHQDLYVV